SSKACARAGDVLQPRKYVDYQGKRTAASDKRHYVKLPLTRKSLLSQYSACLEQVTRADSARQARHAASPRPAPWAPGAPAWGRIDRRASRMRAAAPARACP